MKDKVKYILELPILEAKENLDKDCDIIGLKFNENMNDGMKVLKDLLPFIKKPLMIRGCGNENIDKEFLPQIMELVDRECIFGIVNENNYKEIVPTAIRKGHKVIIRTPIDINLAKEMNILTSDMGLGLDKIIIDTDIGGLGYGLEYGYSTIEKISLENDKYLNMPIISFVAEETGKTKEAKDKILALFLEISATTAVKAAGVEYIVMTKEEALKTLRGLN